ncbi:MAG: flagellar type III secretion system pore protein FliP [Rhizobiaceae bacterium]
MTRLLATGVFLFAGSSPAGSQSLDLQGLTGLADTGTANSVIQIFGLVTVLSVLPAILVAMTSFSRFIIVASILRSGLGLQTTPANLILISLSLFLTFYVMAPVMDRSYNEGILPLIEKKIDEREAIGKIAEPFRGFMLANVRDKDLQLFADLAKNRGMPGFEANEVPFRILVPAFMISELRRGFEIGFLIILPFLVIDLIIATVTMAMGMMMMPPTVIALPMKIMFFVLIDGWHMLAGSLVESYR